MHASKETCNPSPLAASFASVRDCQGPPMRHLLTHVDRLKHLRECLLLALFLWTACARLSATPPEGMAAEDIILKMVERAQRMLDDKERDRYAYTKLAVKEDLDSKGKVKERNEKLIEFELRSARVKQVKINDHIVAESDSRKQKKGRKQEVPPAGQSPSTSREDGWQRYLTRDLLSKYDFALMDRETIKGRPVYVLSFQPKTGDLPEKKWSDRLLNRVGGKLWIDVEEYEIAKATIKLQSEISVGLGILGALKKFDFVIERIRMEGGVWFSSSTRGDFQSRKLFDSSHVKVWSESTNFRRIPPFQ